MSQQPVKRLIAQTWKTQPSENTLSRSLLLRCASLTVCLIGIDVAPLSMQAALRGSARCGSRRAVLVIFVGCILRRLRKIFDHKQVSHYPHRFFSGLAAVTISRSRIPVDNHRGR